MSALKESMMLERGGMVSIVGAGGKTSLMFSLARELAAAGQTVLTTTTTKILVPTKEQSLHLILSTWACEILYKAGKLIKDSPHLTAASMKMPSHAGKLVGISPEVIDEIYKSDLFSWILVEADGSSQKPLKAPAGHEPVIPLSSSIVVGVVGLDSVGKPLDKDSVYRADLFSKITGLAMGELVTESNIVASVCHKEGIFKGSPSDALQILFLNKADSPRRVEAGRKIAALLGEETKSALNRVVIGNALSHLSVVECCDVK